MTSSLVQIATIRNNQHHAATSYRRVGVLDANLVCAPTTKDPSVDFDTMEFSDRVGEDALLTLR